MSEVFGINIDIISKLADIANEKELSEITLSDGEKTITVKGRKCTPPPPPVQSMPVPFGVQSPAPVSAPVPQQTPAKEQEKECGNVIKSPLVGTFYASPSPDKPAFVKVGDRVKKGDVVMIIESMKLMNEIQSDFDGVVDKILVADGQAVEYDQPIMIIK